MPRRDIEFKSGDGVTLRGWLYSPEIRGDAKLPCIVMCHGFSAVKEMDLDAFAEHFSKNLSVACLVFDHRGFGASDHLPGQPRQEIIPALQIEDIQDAITHAQSLPEVDGRKIGIWGSSYSGGHVLRVGAIDKRVRGVVCQAPLVNGAKNFERLIRPDFIPGLNEMFAADRQARAAGNAAAEIPVVDKDPQATSALPTPDSYEFFSKWEAKGVWTNKVTVRSVEQLRGYIPESSIDQISPAPLLMVVAEHDVLTPTDLALRAYEKALEPKQLVILPGGHFDAYVGENFDFNVGAQTSFWKRTFARA